MTPAQRRLLARPDALRGLDRHQPGARRRPRRHRPPARPAAAPARGAPARPPAAASATRWTTRSRSTPRERPSPAELRAELVEAERELDDEGGLVEPATLRRVGLPAARRPRRFGRRGAPVLDARDAVALAALADDLRADPTNGLGVLGRRRRPLGQPASLAGRVASRAAAGLPPGRSCWRPSTASAPTRPRLPDPGRGGRRGHGAPAARRLGRLRPGAVRVAGHRGRPAGHRAAHGRRPAGDAPVPPARRAALVGARAGAAPRHDRPGAGLRRASPRSPRPPGAAPGSPPRAPCG